MRKPLPPIVLHPEMIAQLEQARAERCPLPIDPLPIEGPLTLYGRPVVPAEYFLESMETPPVLLTFRAQPTLFVELTREPLYLKLRDRRP